MTKETIGTRNLVAQIAIMSFFALSLSIVAIVVIYAAIEFLRAEKVALTGVAIRQISSQEIRIAGRRPHNESLEIVHLERSNENIAIFERTTSSKVIVRFPEGDEIVKQATGLDYVAYRSYSSLWWPIVPKLGGVAILTLLVSVLVHNVYRALRLLRTKSSAGSEQPQP